MSLRRYFRTFLAMARYGQWVDDAGWEKSDAVAFQAFMNTPTGVKLAAQIRNMVMRTAQNAVMKPANHAYECGFAAGMTYLAAQQDMLADEKSFTDRGSGDGDPGTNP